MQIFRRAAGAISAGCLLLHVSGVAGAQTLAEFYQGKTISLFIGFSVGGEDDLWARTIARHIGGHIPGNPNVVPQNIPGSAGLLVINRLYNTAPRDGTAIGLINRGIPFEPLLGGQGTQFDVMKMNWIGSPSRDTTVCAARKDAAVQSMADLNTKELAVGGTGSGADTALYPEFLKALLGFKFKLVKGYQGSNDIQLAMERGEVQGICLAFDSLARGPLARSNKINVLLQAALAPEPRVGDVPSVLDTVRSADDRKALELFLARAAIGRPFVAPPGVPTDRIAQLRSAFDATLRDPAFLDDASKQGLDVSPMSGQQLFDIIANTYRAPPDIVKRTLRALGRGD